MIGEHGCGTGNIQLTVPAIRDGGGNRPEEDQTIRSHQETRRETEVQPRGNEI